MAVGNLGINTCFLPAEIRIYLSGVSFQNNGGGMQYHEDTPQNVCKWGHF